MAAYLPERAQFLDTYSSVVRSEGTLGNILEEVNKKISIKERKKLT